jgi:hypothetical protein
MDDQLQPRRDDRVAALREEIRREAQAVTSHSGCFSFTLTAVTLGALLLVAGLGYPTQILLLAYGLTMTAGLLFGWRYRARSTARLLRACAQCPMDDLAEALAPLRDAVELPATRTIAAHLIRSSQRSTELTPATPGARGDEPSPSE